jgi:hypothetical protein
MSKLAHDTTVEQNNSVDANLDKNCLKAVDVRGDGNCLFRAVCYSLQGTEAGHEQLRNQTVDWLEGQGQLLGGVDVSPDDGYDLTKHVQSVRTLCTPVGEDALVVIANVCKRQLAVHIARSDPVVYSPDDCDSVQGTPISVAFYAPGHYKAVVRGAAACSWMHPASSAHLDTTSDNSELNL